MQYKEVAAFDIECIANPGHTHLVNNSVPMVNIPELAGWRFAKCDNCDQTVFRAEGDHDIYGHLMHVIHEHP